MHWETGKIKDDTNIEFVAGGGGGSSAYINTFDTTQSNNVNVWFQKCSKFTEVYSQVG